MIPCRYAAYCPSPLIPQKGFCQTNAQCLNRPPTQFETLGCGGSVIEGFCPNQTYCPNASVSIPCTNQYCPAGIVEPLKCPGFICANGVLLKKVTLIVTVLSTVISVLLLLSFWLKIKRIITEICKMKRTVCYAPLVVDRQTSNESTRDNDMISNYFRPFTDHEQTTSDKIEINVQFQNAQLDIPSWDSKNRGLTGTIKAGQLTAILGQSGCGKTQFLCVIQGRTRLKSGQISVNNHDPFDTRLSNLVGYVPQDDILHQDLTVFETVYYSARARRLNVNPLTIKHDVHFILGKLNMNRKLNEQIQHLSGGQRKRVNIAMEIAACPKLLLLDEPTSGLDSFICEKLFSLLSLIKHSQDGPVNIIMVIHQPGQELFNQIDHVLFFTPKCYLAYQGRRTDALTFLKKKSRMDISDAIPLLNTCDECIYTLRHYPDINHYVETTDEFVLNPLSSSLCSCPTLNVIFKPIVYLIYRTMTQLCYRNCCTEVIYAISYFILGLIVGILFDIETQSCNINVVPSIYFMISLAFGAATCVSSQRLFGVEIVNQTFVRESRNYYHPVQYWIAKTIVSSLYIVLYPVLFLTLLHIEIQPRASFNQYYSVLLLMSFSCSGIGQLVSVFFNRTEDSYLAGTIIALISCLISGFNPTKNGPHAIKGAVYLSYSRHVQRQLFIFDMEKYIQNNNTTNNLWHTQIEQLRRYYSYNDDEHSVLSLLIIGTLCRLLTIAFLYAKSEYRSIWRYQ
ncbi:unnamed protein product, partial [Didymodactylos carnosus]